MDNLKVLDRLLTAHSNTLMASRMVATLGYKPYVKTDDELPALEATAVRLQTIADELQEIFQEVAAL